MNASDKKRDEALNAIGRKLDDLCLSGHLNLEGFKALFTRALRAAGPDTDDLEMFESVIQDRGWRDWMISELRKVPARRVA
jgi:hypothetical protein